MILFTNIVCECLTTSTRYLVTRAENPDPIRR